MVKLIRTILAIGTVWVAKKLLGAVDGNPDGAGVVLKTRLLNTLSKSKDRRNRLAAARRLQFKRIERIMAPSHTHPDAAALRAEASLFMSEVCRVLDGKRYDVSMSSRERRNGAAGCRSFRNTKDLLNEPYYDKLTDEHIVTFVDVEPHMTMKQLSKFAGHDMVIYTLQPEGLSGVTKDSQWRFISEDEVEEEVSGGAIYRQKVWNWKKDVIVLTKGFRTYIYDPVLYNAGPSRYVIALVLARTVLLPGLITRLLIPDLASNFLSRLNVEKHGKFLTGMFGPPNSRSIHILMMDHSGAKCVVISPEAYQACAIASEIPNTDKLVPKRELLPAGAERILKHHGEKLLPHASHVVSAYFTTSYRPHKFVNVQSREGLDYEDGKCGTTLAAVPLVGPSVGHTSSENNERRALLTRVEMPRNTTKFGAKMAQYAAEFSERINAGKPPTSPIGMEDVRLAQSSSSQKSRRVQEEPHLPKQGPMSTSTFQKGEANANISDPRAINQVPTAHTNTGSMYSYAVSQRLKATRWYGVGKSPEQIARALQGLEKSCGEAGTVGGDYKRMDAATSVDYRIHVFEPIVAGMFDGKHQEEVLELLRAERNVSTVTKRFKLTAKLTGANISGSPFTTALNTCNAAFNEYAAWREHGLEPADAYRKLGLYFGDDSVTSAEIFPTVCLVAARNGMTLVEEERPEDAGKGHVVFLSRVYPNILTSLTSHPVVVRSLRKLCTVQAPSSANKDEVLHKLSLKVDAVKRTEKHVPVLREYANALWSIYDLGKYFQGKGATAEKKEWKFKTSLGQYPYSPSDDELILPSVASGLGISVEEVRLLCSRLSSCKTENDLAAIKTEVKVAEMPEWAIAVPN